jgi:hypothetical protein
MAAVFTCPPGSICSPQAKTPVGPNKTGIFHASATNVTTQGSNGEVTGAETVVYIIKNDTFQPAAITKDGGKTYAFSDPNYPLMAGVAGADLQNDLKNPQGAIRKNVDAGVAQSVDKAGLKPVDKKTIVASTANNAPDPGTGAGSQGGDPNNAALLADISTPAKGTRMSFSQTLRYPEKLKSEHQDVISFNMLKYEPRKLSEGGTGNLGTFGQRSDFKTRIIGKVTLPIPNGISDANSVTWNGETITSAQKALADLAAAGITGGLKSAADTAGNQIDQAQAAAPEIAQGLASYFTEQAVGTTNLLSRTQGAIQNPNLELLFSAPTLRPFNFTFKLASRSEAESKIIRSIIRFFKQGMSPQRSQSNLFLKAPHTFQIQYLHRKEEHKFLNKFKECALQSFNVSYTPEGQYATFTDGAMVSYQITMQFQELEPIFNDDYTSLDQNNDTEIGF